MAQGFSLHIGLNSVDSNHYGGWSGQLRGCENDARAMEKIARSLQYIPTMLLSGDATVGNVTAAISSVAAAMNPGDTFWLTYSGHGGQVPDGNNDESTRDKHEWGEIADQYDETWVLYDRMLVDDELWALWAEFPEGSRIILFSDSCHSGTVSKAQVPGGAFPWQTEMTNAEGEQVATRRMPLDVEDATYNQNKETYDTVQTQLAPRPTSENRVQATIALVSGCQDNQESLDGRVNGAFTGKLLDVWADGALKGSIRGLRDFVAQKLPPSQTPNYYVIGKPNRRWLASPALRI